tara:strand:- start:349 stop:876 length:528 start_codon:yes stop_codon:yes gene_type:complete
MDNYNDIDLINEMDLLTLLDTHQFTLRELIKMRYNINRRLMNTSGSEEDLHFYKNFAERIDSSIKDAIFQYIRRRRNEVLSSANIRGLNNEQLEEEFKRIDTELQKEFKRIHTELQNIRFPENYEENQPPNQQTPPFQIAEGKKTRRKKIPKIPKSKRPKRPKTPKSKRRGRPRK